ncbi:hypothetical protein FOCC_FOCC011281 [Frankliniella occidentalis]|nr:hypothetical protein FOCC_FOCC011281 [Frankliniella occidentalis]
MHCSFHPCSKLTFSIILYRISVKMNFLFWGVSDKHKASSLSSVDVLWKHLWELQLRKSPPHCNMYNFIALIWLTPFIVKLSSKMRCSCLSCLLFWNCQERTNAMPAVYVHQYLKELQRLSLEIISIYLEFINIHFCH